MSEDRSTAAYDDGASAATGTPMATTPPWGLVLTAGIVAFLLGVVLAAWPGETVKVLAFLLALQLIVVGVAQVVMGLASRDRVIGWAIVIAGVISLVVGILFLFNPLQTLTFIGWAIGIYVAIAGAVDLFGAFSTNAGPHRLWQGVRGALGVVIGLLLMAHPHWSLGALVLIMCVWLISYGFITIVAAFLLRSEERRGSTV